MKQGEGKGGFVASDDIWARVDWWDLIIALVRNEKKGKRCIRCPHPSHDDHKPSFVINEKGTWGQCYSECAWGGDVIAGYMWLKGISYSPKNYQQILVQMARDTGNANLIQEGNGAYTGNTDSRADREKWEKKMKAMREKAEAKAQKEKEEAEAAQAIQSEVCTDIWQVFINPNNKHPKERNPQAWDYMCGRLEGSPELPQALYKGKSALVGFYSDCLEAKIKEIVKGRDAHEAVAKKVLDYAKEYPIFFPYSLWDSPAGQVDALQRRCVGEPKQKEYRFNIPYGTRIEGMLFGVAGLHNWIAKQKREKKDSRIIVCEGATDALAWIRYKHKEHYSNGNAMHDCVALLACGSSAEGLLKLFKEKMLKDAWGGEVLIALDNDKASKPQAKKLKDLLTDARVPYSGFPLGEGEDLNKWVNREIQEKEQSQDTSQEAQEEAIQEPSYEETVVVHEPLQAKETEAQDPLKVVHHIGATQEGLNLKQAWQVQEKTSEERLREEEKRQAQYKKETEEKERRLIAKWKGGNGN